MKKERHKIVPASYLVLMKDDKIMLLRRFNTGYEDGNYSMIAGHVDSGENFTQCIIREAKEEADVDLNPCDLKVACVMNRNSHTKDDNERVDLFFVAKKWKGEVKNMECHKCDDLSWFDLNEIPENTIPYIKRVIENIKNGVFYDECGWEE
ncbi:MAG: NUDIX domain-containing protein [Candidatus Moranbacteria bacterium]|nr:NUDIX domain-containing protein [Candidatus Moranbacteria bacterium]